jgi:hypothetical protein
MNLADTWALDCILFAMLTAKLLFDMSNVLEMFQKPISRQMIFRDHPELYIKPSAKIFFWRVTVFQASGYIISRESKKLSTLLFFQFINTKVGVEQVRHFST